MGLSILELYRHADTFARAVVWIMLAMSFLSLTVAIGKMIRIRKSASATRKFAPAFSRAIQEEQLDQAIALSEKNQDSHIAKVLGGALTEVKPLLRGRATITAADINSAERAVERQMLITLTEFKRGMGILATVSSTAPFVGLLGTCMGIINALSAVGASGGLAGIAGGISRALITTALGLLVAIPAVWFYHYFTTKVENLTVEMTYSSKELIDYLIKSVGSGFGRSVFAKEFQAQKRVTGSGRINGEPRPALDEGEDPDRGPLPAIIARYQGVKTGLPEVPGDRIDRVHFSVSAPPSAPPGAAFIVNVWGHLGADRDAVLARAREAAAGAPKLLLTKGPTQVTRGTVLSVRLSLEGLQVLEPEDTILWEGEVGSAAFAVRVPKDVQPGPHQAQVAVYVNGLRIARIDFVLNVASKLADPVPVDVHEHRHKTAFASYASEDREQVAARIRVSRKALRASTSSGIDIR
ncbi:MAG: MotA/TolQ/ExbB proton channel family protein [Gemmatimonadales bacterium]